MWTRRQLFSSGIMAGVVTLLAGGKANAQANNSRRVAQRSTRTRYKPVITLNGTALASKMKNGVREFHLVAEPVDWEFAPGMKVKVWGYNGRSPGPTIRFGAAIGSRKSRVVRSICSAPFAAQAAPSDMASNSSAGRNDSLSISSLLRVDSGA